MKILIVSQYFWPENFRLNDLCRELVLRGHEVTVLTGKPNYPRGKIFDEYIINPDQFSFYNGVKIKRVPIIPRGNTKKSLIFNYISYMLSASTYGLWLLRNNKFDAVFVCQLSPATVAVPGLVLSKFHRVPLVMWVLDLWPDSLEAVGIIKNKRILNIISLGMRTIYNNCKIVFVQSQSFKNRIKTVVSPNTQVLYVPTWAEDEFSAKNSRSNEFPNLKNEFVITFAGNIGKAQDLDCILNTAKILKTQPNIKFWIIGDGRDFSRVKNLVKKYNLTETVKLLGHHPLEKMPEFYEKSTALLVTLQDRPIFAATVPGKLQSYLSYGKPIIGAINGDARSIIETSKSGVCVSAGDHEALANAVLEVSKLTHEQQKQLGENGAEFYRRNFAKTIVIDKFEKNLIETVRKYN